MTWLYKFWINSIDNWLSLCPFSDVFLLVIICFVEPYFSHLVFVTRVKNSYVSVISWWQIRTKTSQNSNVCVNFAFDSSMNKYLSQCFKYPWKSCIYFQYKFLTCDATYICYNYVDMKLSSRAGQGRVRYLYFSMYPFLSKIQIYLFEIK